MKQLLLLLLVVVLVSCVPTPTPIISVTVTPTPFPDPTATETITVSITPTQEIGPPSTNTPTRTPAPTLTPEYTQVPDSHCLLQTRSGNTNVRIQPYGEVITQLPANTLFAAVGWKQADDGTLWVRRLLGGYVARWVIDYKGGCPDTIIAAGPASVPPVQVREQYPDG